MAYGAKRAAADQESFARFYRESFDILKTAQKDFNKVIKKQKNPILRTFTEDLADLNGGGKLLRGMLIRLGYRLGGGRDGELATPLANAYELFQTAVLIHDDIIDQADVRRGKMTVHRRYALRCRAHNMLPGDGSLTPEHVGSGAALCVGDWGLYRAHYEIVKAYAGKPYLAELLSYFDETVMETMMGELLDVVLPGEMSDDVRTEEEKKKLLERSVIDIYRQKTARYTVVGPLHLGMILAGADADLMKKVDRIAEDIGVAYQVMDDILGIFADEQYLGKDVGSDISEYKQTILYAYVRNNDVKATEKLHRVYGRKDIGKEELDEVKKIFKETGALEYSVATMKGLFEKAGRRLSRTDLISEEDKAILRGFMAYLSGRRK